MPKSTSLSDPNLIALIRLLNKTNNPLYRTVAQKIQSPRRKRVDVNVGKLNRYTKTGDMVIVPGKVLAAGTLTHPLTVAALSFSEQARQQIEGVEGTCLTIGELVEQNPEGTGLTIII